MSRARGVIVVLALVAACKAQPPDPGIPGGGGPDAGAAFADLVLDWTEAGVAMSCTDALPSCGAVATCGPVAVLGPPDAVTYDLAPGDTIDVALLCSHVLELGGPGSADLKLWASFADGASAVVEVSFDGAVWQALATVSASDPALDLAQVGLDVVRFIRVANRGSAAIALDAVEALR